MPLTEKRIMLLSAILFLLAAVFSVGFIHVDEHFQILEFAALKLGLTTPEALPWEYPAAMRPAFQPALIVGLYHVAGWFGQPDPFVVTFISRLLSAILAFTGIWLMVNAYRSRFGNGKLYTWFLLLSFLFWVAVFNGVRFSSESWSGSLFLIGFALIGLRNRYSSLQWLLIGMVMGLSFVTRFQAGLMIAGLVIWLAIVRRQLREAILLSAGVLLMAALGVALDSWYYGRLTVTAWNYLNQNLVHDKVSQFGIQPWWFYFTETVLMGITPLTLLFLVAPLVVFVFRRTDALTFTLLPFIVVHFLIGHKEVRFLLPLVGFMPVVVAEAILVVKERFSTDLTTRLWFGRLVGFSLLVNYILLVYITFRPADDLVALYRTVYYQFPGKSVLYYTEGHPYRSLLDYTFYRNPGMQLQQIPPDTTLKPLAGHHSIFVTRNPDAVKKLGLQPRLVYTTVPQWAKRFDFNGWVGRTKSWYVYELK